MREDFRAVLEAHRARYPLMEPQDVGKLIFQSEYGPEHMIVDIASVREYLQRELAEELRDSSPAVPEDIGGGLCRFPLSLCPPGAGDLLAELFALTGETCRGTEQGLREKLSLAAESGIEGMAEWALSWEGAGFSAVHHSEAFRRAYHPHYRLVRKSYARCLPALWEIGRALSAKAAKPGQGPLLVAVDGRCGSGKTSFAALAARLFPCNVLHMDDFYLPMERRAENWTELPGGNMDFERFLREVLLPVRAGENPVYRPYSCQKGVLGEGERLPRRPLAVVEGSYSQHPLLAGQYDLKIFLTCPGEEQAQRLQAREGSYFEMFRERWIPMEERYFQSFGIKESCDLVVDTGEDMEKSVAGGKAPGVS